MIAPPGRADVYGADDRVHAAVAADGERARGPIRADAAIDVEQVAAGLAERPRVPAQDAVGAELGDDPGAVSAISTLPSGIASSARTSPMA